MNVTSASLERINQHWAIKAIGTKAINQVFELSNSHLVEKSVGKQIHLNYEFSPADYELLKRVSFAYEIAAIEGLNDFLHPTSTNNELREQCASAACRAFEIQRVLKPPAVKEQRIYHILHLSSLAYCGERWTELHHWYNENDKLLQTPSVANALWDRRLLYRLYECWVILFRKKYREDLHRISEIIAELREDQKHYEGGVFNDTSNTKNRAMAIRLICLYHWAKATEIQATAMLQSEPEGVTTLLNKHFESAIKAAMSVDSQLEIELRWLQIASHQMITDPLVDGKSGQFKCHTRHSH
ncbi:MAG: hypothetical protein OXC02_08935 [Rhodobacteraceae bacterium]|nr:hypothetical protein [Paracoccaceae bacterium]